MATTTSNPARQQPVHARTGRLLRWQLPNERWSVRPLKGLRVVLPAGTKDHPLTFTLHRRLPHPPEAYPSCIARALYLTSDGDVVQSEHTFTIVAAHAAR